MSSSVRSIHKNVMLALAAAAILGAAAQAAEPAKEDPAAIAASLEKQAADLRASAAKHEHMGKMHQAGAGSPKENHYAIVKHCETLAKDLRAAADESDALAAEYRKEAKK